MHTINSPGYDWSSIAATNSASLSGKHHFELNLDWLLDCPYHPTNVNHDSARKCMIQLPPCVNALTLGALAQTPLLHTEPTTEQEARKRNLSARGVIVTLVLNAVLPFLIYQGMTNVLHQSGFVSLVVTAIPSALMSLASLVRQRRINLLAGIVLLGIVIGLLISFVSKDPRLLLVRDAFFAEALGLALLISLCFPKPLTYYASLLFRKRLI